MLERSLNREPVAQVVQRVAELVDLVVAVGRGDLDPEANLGAWHQRVGREGDVDARLVQEASYFIDVLGVLQGYLDDRQAGGVGCRKTQLGDRLQDLRGLSVQRALMSSPRLSLTSKPASTVAREATGDGPEYR